MMVYYICTYLTQGILSNTRHLYYQTQANKLYSMYGFCMYNNVSAMKPRRLTPHLNYHAIYSYTLSRFVYKYEEGHILCKQKTFQHTLLY